MSPRRYHHGFHRIQILSKCGTLTMTQRASVRYLVNCPNCELLNSEGCYLFEEWTEHIEYFPIKKSSAPHHQSFNRLVISKTPHRMLQHHLWLEDQQTPLGNGQESCPDMLLARFAASRNAVKHTRQPLHPLLLNSFAEGGCFIPQFHGQR